MKGLAKLAGMILIFIILIAKNKILAPSGYSGNGIKLIANIVESQKVEIRLLPESHNLAEAVTVHNITNKVYL